MTKVLRVAMENSQSKGRLEPIVFSDYTVPEGGFRVDMTERNKLIEAYDTRTVLLKFSESLSSFQSVKRWIHENWSEGGISSIRDTGHGLYLVMFDHPQAASQILAQGPWRNHKTYAFVGKWRHGMDPLSFTFPSRPIWIELPGLPQEFQGPANLQDVAKLFGEPRIIQSSLDSSDGCPPHLRICVLWEEQKLLPESVTYFGPEGEVLLKQKVVLRCLPGACSRCQILSGTMVLIVKAERGCVKFPIRHL